MKKSQVSAKSTFTKMSCLSKNFRVLLKQRNNPKETFNMEKSRYLMEKDEAGIKNGPGQTVINISERQDLTGMKQFVRTHLKTEYIEPVNQLQSKNSLSSFPRENHSRIYTEPIVEMSKIEQRVDELIDAKLLKCSTTHNINTQSNQRLNTELTEAINNLRQIREQQNPEFIEADIKLLNHKIKIIEKAIAESNTESELLKKHYLCQVSQRSNKKCLSETSQCFFRKANEIKLDNKSTHARIKSIGYESISRSSFQKPSRKDYDIYRYQDTFFNAGRHQQPLHRSSYNRDFLNYGAMPEQMCKPVDSDCFVNPPKHQLISSSYRESFQPKSVEKINYRDLDCYRDKFKKLPIQFGKRQNNQLANKYYKLLKVAHGPLTKNLKNLIQPTHYSKNMVSESRREYCEVPSLVLKSNIKDGDLNKLKYSFKQKINA